MITGQINDNYDLANNSQDALDSMHMLSYQHPPFQSHTVDNRNNQIGSRAGSRVILTEQAQGEASAAFLPTQKVRAKYESVPTT